MQFRRNTFDLLAPARRASRLAELEQYLSERLERSTHFHEEIRGIVASLRSQGHDLWSWDESDDFEIWGPDYMKPSMTGLLIDFRAPAVVEVSWCEDADPSDARQVFGEGYH